MISMMGIKVDVIDSTSGTAAANKNYRKACNHNSSTLNKCISMANKAHKFFQTNQSSTPNPHKKSYLPGIDNDVINKKLP
mgnify:CR=1 FL=1